MSQQEVRREYVVGSMAKFITLHLNSPAKTVIPRLRHAVLHWERQCTGTVRIQYARRDWLRFPHADGKGKKKNFHVHQEGRGREATLFRSCNRWRLCRAPR